MDISLNGGINSSQSSSNNKSESWAANQAAAANAWSAEQAALAHERQKELLQMTMDFNAAEAQKSRDWEQANINVANEMANTVYSRSMKDMQSAGINPILAAGAGLGAAGSGSVTSGSGASVGTPSTFMGQTTAQYNSASKSQGESSGSSYGESGLATGLKLIGDMISGALGSLASSTTVNVALDGLKDLFKTSPGEIVDEVVEKAEKDSEADKKDYSNQNKTGKDRHGNTVRHLSKDTNPEPGSFTYGLEQWLRARNML